MKIVTGAVRQVLSAAPEGLENGEKTRLSLLRNFIVLLRELAYTPANAESLIREGAPLILVQTLELVASDYQDEVVEVVVDVL